MGGPGTLFGATGLRQSNAAGSSSHVSILSCRAGAPARRRRRRRCPAMHPSSPRPLTPQEGPPWGEGASGGSLRCAIRPRRCAQMNAHNCSWWLLAPPQGDGACVVGAHLNLGVRVGEGEAVGALHTRDGGRGAQVMQQQVAQAAAQPAAAPPDKQLSRPSSSWRAALW